MRVLTSVNRQVPSAADADLKIGDSLLVYRDNPVSRWIGPFRSIDLDKKSVIIFQNGRPVRYSVDLCKQYRPETPEKHDLPDLNIADQSQLALKFTKTHKNDGTLETNTAT